MEKYAVEKQGIFLWWIKCNWSFKNGVFFNTHTNLISNHIKKKYILDYHTGCLFFFYYEWGRGKIILNLIQPEKKNFLGTILRFLNYEVSGANGVCFWLLYIDFFTNLIFLSICMLRSFCYSILRLNERWNADFQHIKACVELG